MPLFFHNHKIFFTNFGASVILLGQIFWSGSLMATDKFFSVINDLPLGRNIDEMLRIIDALIHHDEHGEVCPAGWTKGKTAMKASNDGVREYLSAEADNL